jgi:hypothetical protein
MFQLYSHHQAYLQSLADLYIDTYSIYMYIDIVITRNGMGLVKIIYGLCRLVFLDLIAGQY